MGDETPPTSRVPHEADPAETETDPALEVSDEPDPHVLPDEVEYPDHGPPRLEGWRKRSASGAILSGFALGLREVLEPEIREPAIVMETSGIPPTDLPVETNLANVPPRRSVVKIRRWLLPGASDLPEDQTSGPSCEDIPEPAQRQAD